MKKFTRILATAASVSVAITAAVLAGPAYAESPAPDESGTGATGPGSISMSGNELDLHSTTVDESTVAIRSSTVRFGANDQNKAVAIDQETGATEALPSVTRDATGNYVALVYEIVSAHEVRVTAVAAPAAAPSNGLLRGIGKDMKCWLGIVGSGIGGGLAGAAAGSVVPGLGTIAGGIAGIIGGNAVGTAAFCS